MDSLFFTSPVVQDIMDFMAFAVNPLDCDVFERIYYKLGAGISKEKMQFAVAESRVAGEPPLKILAADNDLSKYVRTVCQNRLYDFRYMSRMRADTAIAYAVEEWYGEYSKERKRAWIRSKRWGCWGGSSKRPHTCSIACKRWTT